MNYVRQILGQESRFTVTRNRSLFQFNVFSISKQGSITKTTMIAILNETQTVINYLQSLSVLLIRLSSDPFIDDEDIENDESLYHLDDSTFQISNDEDMPLIEKSTATNPVSFRLAGESQSDEHFLSSYPGEDDYPIWKVDCKVC